MVCMFVLDKLNFRQACAVTKGIDRISTGSIISKVKINEILVANIKHQNYR